MPQGSSSTATLTDEQILGLEPGLVDSASGVPASGGRSAADAEAFKGTSDIGTSGEVQDAPDPWENRPRTGGPAGDASQADPAELLNDENQPPSSGSTGLNSSATSGTESDPAWLKTLESQPQGGAEAAAQARAWRTAATDIAGLDAAYFSTDSAARSGLATRLYDSNPAAFRAMLAESAALLSQRDPQALAELFAAPITGAANARPLAANSLPTPLTAGGAPQPAAREVSPSPAAPGAQPQFPAEAYRSFETATNDEVARRVQQAINHTLNATLPEGTAEGARRRIANDIFQEVHASLAADRDLAQRVGETLRDWRFDGAARQQLSALLTGRARAVLPEVARRVVTEWTSSVLASDRAKTARIDAAAARRDVTGGRLPEPVPGGSLRPRDLDYRRLSDEQILEL